MITISAMKWVPPFAAGHIRDYRLRWVLKEVGWPYEVRLIDAPTLRLEEYLEKQPFGQVPYLEEDSRPTLFESGAIVIDVAGRAGKLIPPEGPERAKVITWVIAALNSIEPFVMNVAEVDYFTSDEREKALRRPRVVAAADARLKQLERALGARKWIVTDEFSVADLMLASVLRNAQGLGLLDELQPLSAYLARCLDRPAFRDAIEEQCATFAAHTMDDMHFSGI
jgi:glutathione S-transferase